MRTGLGRFPRLRVGLVQQAYDQGQIGQPERAVEQARRLTEQRPKEPRSWLTLAEKFDVPQHRQACMDAIERAIECDPRSVAAHGMKTDVLTTEGRLDEALAACRPEIFGCQPPLVLQAREAVVHAQQGADALTSLSC